MSHRADELVSFFRSVPFHVCFIIHNKKKRKGLNFRVWSDDVGLEVRDFMLAAVKMNFHLQPIVCKCIIQSMELNNQIPPPHPTPVVHGGVLKVP